MPRRKLKASSTSIDGVISGRKMKLLEQKIDKLRIRLKNKTDDRKTTEGVFDTKTLFHLYYLITHNHLDRLFGVLSTGKEANVYYGEALPFSSKEASAESSEVNEEQQTIEPIAVKIYRTSTADFKRMRDYIHGDPRFQRIRHGTRPLIYAWAQKEYKNLVLISKTSIPVPEPLAVRGNVLTMRFLGEAGLPAPRLKDYIITSEKEANYLFQKLFKYLKILYQDVKLVHADFSEYNILIWDEPYIIDVSQAVPLEHPTAEEYLERDVSNLVRYFTKQGILTPTVEELIQEIHEKNE